MAGQPFVFPETDGEISVDYRSNDGNIILGSGSWLFATKWSAAGSGAIHAYRDGGPQVAVAPGVNHISQVTPKVFNQADFTSRVRTPRVGEVVLWLNANGYATAVEIIRVTVAQESSAGANLVAKYRILSDKSRDFSMSGNPLDSNFRRTVRAALSTFDALEDILDSPQAEVGIGHNNPPPEAQLAKEDYAQLGDQLHEALSNEIDETRLRTLILVSQASLLKVGEAIETRFHMVREGFYRQLGAMAAIVIVGLVTWLTFYGNLQDVGVAATALGAHLFGFH